MTVRDNKDFDESKLEAAEIKLTASSPIVSKISNFWYYHKWKVIIISFFAVVLAVGIFQMVTREESDTSIIIAVPQYLEGEQVAEIDSTLTSLLPAGKDGSVLSLDVYNYAIYSEKEMEEANHAETDSEGKYILQVSGQYNTSQMEAYTSYMQTGECSVLIVSEYLYNKLTASDRVLPLENVFDGKKPVGALSDGYGVRLGDTYLYQFSDSVRQLPADSVVCILRAYVMGANSKEENYNTSKEFFKNIVTFGE